MPEILTKTNEIVKCQHCGNTNFKVIKHPVLHENMGFCSNCSHGKAVEQLINRFNVGTITYHEFCNQYQISEV